MPSENPDDLGTIPLYEQIYAMAGLAQFYRISADWEVLHDIRRTIAAIKEFYLDKSEYGSYFSHIDPVTFSPPQSRSRPQFCAEELELGR